ncbi:MAG: YggS family pyridoxal phosphate-dependent enzyme [Flavobacteriales bacterium]|nr:YggS family pyridoxal phosphate-dependent enzyme [Flavobacteriales bacterium]
MKGIAEHLMSVKDTLPDGVTLVAVSKTHPARSVLEAYMAGHRDFGENRVQELLEKYDALPKDIRWHLIGHLQRNKVKAIAAFVHLIHSIDSERLLEEVNQQAMKCERVIDVLLQFHVAREETKHGFSLEEAEEMLRSSRFSAMRNIRVVGVMGMATFTDDGQQVRSEFARLRSIFHHLKVHCFQENAHFTVLSMGMSGDYGMAIGEGSTMVRVGSAIFGHRAAV